MGLHWTMRLGAATLGLALTMSVGLLASARAQDPPPPPTPTPAPVSPKSNPAAPKVPSAKGKTNSAAASTRKGTRLVPGGPVGKVAKGAADPLAKVEPNANAQLKAAIEAGTFHYKLKLAAADGSTTLAVSYYPSRLGTGSSVVLMIHERDRSGKDFQEAIVDLDHKSLAEHLQKLGIAVLTLDLRGQGENPRRAVTSRDWRAMPADLQSAYVFLLDRHNRGELNLNRLGVIGVGEGANLAVNWAAMPGAAVSGEGRATDLGGLILISPMIDANAQGMLAQRPLTALSQKLPIAVLAGERDPLSSDLVKASQAALRRSRINNVKTYPSSLHGYKLLRLEPGIGSEISRFLEDTIKARGESWEPRYNLTPVAYSEARTIANPNAKKPGDEPAAAPKNDAAK